MLKRLSAKFKKKDKASAGGPQVGGAAIPYNDKGKNGPKNGEDEDHLEGVGASSSCSASLHSYESGSSSSDGHVLMDAAAKGDIETIRQLIKTSACNVNYTDGKGNTPVIKAASKGHSKTLRYLLMKGADIDARNKRGRTALYTALQYGHTGTVGVILDFMHSVDNKPREPFIMVRAVMADGKDPFVEEAYSCKELVGYKSRGVEFVQILVAQQQIAEDMSVYLYSVLDVPIHNTFIINGIGDMNMRNFQRFETKEQTKSISVLDTYVRTIEMVAYKNLKTLILVSCALGRIVMEGLQSLELLDVRYNSLTSLPPHIKHCKKLRTLRISDNNIKRLPKEIGELTDLVSLDCSYNPLRRLPSHIVKCRALRSIHVDHTELSELPIDIGELRCLQELNISHCKVCQIPLSVSTMEKLQKISFRANPLQNIPVDFPERADDVRQYLRSLQDDPIPNNTIKLVLVGQEGVGKTTLLKAIKRTLWVLPRAPNTDKTEGIDVKEIQIDDINLRCYDCGGDVDFYETHNFFITQGALYLACFNLSEYVVSTMERNSFLLGRLQLWLQYIFSKVPNAQVVIVGTHADHSSLKKNVFEEIWEQLRTLLVNAREHHRQYFSSRSDRLSDCLLCQSDSRCLRKSTGAAGAAGFVNLGFQDNVSLDEETSFNDGPAQVVSFPHIVGYYEVSSVKSMGNDSIFQVTSNASIEHLKDCVKELAKRMTKNNPEIPRRWANALSALKNKLAINPEDCISSLEEVGRIAAAQGVPEGEDLIHMLHFLKAQGHLLFFPKSDDLKDLVILDPEWLAKIFSSIISFKETGINIEGFIEQDKLKKVWSYLDDEMQKRVLYLLHYFNLSLSTGTSLELFPCKLPLGEPDDFVWPASPSRGQRQVTYCVTFPSIIPPPFFSDLIVSVYRNRVLKNLAGESTTDAVDEGYATRPAGDDGTKYFSNHIVDYLNLRYHGCKDCDPVEGVGAEQDIPVEERPHQIHIELIPHRRTINITIRGAHPCCMMKKCGKLLDKVVAKFDGMSSVELSTVVCPGCLMQNDRSPHKYSAAFLAKEPSASEKLVCSNSHSLHSGRGVLMGKLHDSCLPSATLRPKSKMDKMDYTGCPKLFILLPVNKEGISFDKDLKLFVQSLLFDGFAVHLLCEFPDGYHLTRSPGYRVKRPEDFMKLYGSHVIAVLRMMRNLAQSSVVSGPHTKAVTDTIDDLIKDICSKFTGVKDLPLETTPEQLMTMLHERGSRINRVDLRQFLMLIDKPDYFGPLRRLKYGEQLLWLCNEHYKQLRVLTIAPPPLEPEVPDSRA